MHLPLTLQILLLLSSGTIFSQLQIITPKAVNLECGFFPFQFTVALFSEVVFVPLFLLCQHHVQSVSADISRTE